MALQYKSIECSHDIIGKFRIVMGGKGGGMLMDCSFWCQVLGVFQVFLT